MLIPLGKLLEKYKDRFRIRGVLHVGAHECEESKDYAAAGAAPVFWIEALPELVRQQRQNGHDVHAVLASDEDDKELTFYVTNNLASSSMLPLKVHLQMHPHVAVAKTITLKTRRLDTWIAKERIDLANVNFLNLDIQGAELKALKGLGTHLGRFDAVYTEVNVAELYENCVLLPDLDKFLEAQGFERVETDITGYQWGDALYLRKQSNKPPADEMTIAQWPTTTTPARPADDASGLKPPPGSQTTPAGQPRERRVRPPGSAASSGSAGSAGAAGAAGGEVTILTVGGLGNQLFTIAAGLAYAWRTGRKPVCLRRSWSDSVHAPRPVYWSTLFKTLETTPGDNAPEPADAKWHVDGEPGYREIPRLEQHRHIGLRGYLQSPRYFRPYWTKIMKTLFSNELVVKAHSLLPKPPEGKRWAFVHFRRGDYTRDGGPMVIPLPEYYDQAAPLFPPKAVAFLVFCEAESRGEVERDLNASPAFKGRDWQIADQNIPDYLQLLMMACCPAGGMIANSTFSVWAGYAHSHPAVPKSDSWFLLYTTPAEWRWSFQPDVNLDEWLVVGHKIPKK